jgi:hypothetical protein
LLKLCPLLLDIPAHDILHRLHSLERITHDVNVDIFFVCLEMGKLDSQKRAVLLELGIDLSMIDAHVSSGERIEKGGKTVLEVRVRTLQEVWTVSVADGRSE